ncbi:heavy metal transporter [Microbacterium ureisolvens]|uniref:heavy metal transporter n=1 Tax=Microbacterium ureisolvens TaxID=2781186 RepID=UPI0036407003
MTADGRPGEKGRPARVRVTADLPASAAAATHGIALPGAPVREAGAVYVGGLVRSQLRLAFGCLLGFLLVAGAFTAAIFVVAHAGDPVVAGVPLSWLLQAYGYYPLILVFAVLYARAAARNERRYRSLSDADAATDAVREARPAGATGAPAGATGADGAP